MRPLYYLDYSHKSQLTLKQYLKRFARLLLRKRRRYCSFVPLYYDPSRCDFVLLRSASPIEALSVNGIPVTFEAVGRKLYKVSPQYFEPWENVIFADTLDCTLLPGFYEPEKIMPELLPKTFDFTLRRWKRGKVRKITTKSPEHIDKSLSPQAAVWQYIHRSQNRFSNSKYCDLFFPSYDVTWRSYRLNSWVWCSGIAVRLFVNEYQRQGDEHFLHLARRVADALARFQQTTGPERGGFEVRWDFSRQAPQGVIRWLAPNDSAFIATNAFISLFECTKENRYLDIALATGEWIARRGIDPSGRLYHGYILDEERWVKDCIYVDSGFTASLFVALAEITQDEKWTNLTTLFVDDFIARFQSDEGYFFKMWYAPDQLEDRIFARGQAWALDALLSAYDLLDEQTYLDSIIKCADFLLRHQQKDGSWHYLINDSQSGQDNKGIPIIAYHLLRLYEMCNKGAYRQAAKQALLWCEQHIYRGADPYARGGICAHSAEGNISGIRNVTTSFFYANIYYLLASNKLGEW
jgi:rhamnogalacturonyl hydrolase YesR